MSKYIIKNSNTDLIKDDKTSEFETRLSSIVIDRDKENEIIHKDVADSLGKAILENFIPFGDAISKVLNLGDKIERDIREKKKEYLFGTYFKNVDDLALELGKMKDFVSNPYGSMLYSKIISILNENIPNTSFIELFSQALRKMINSDFESLFETHKYALDLLGRLSPQALIILVDCPRWPSYQLGSYGSEKGVITSEWISKFVQEYAKSKGISNQSVIRRMSHALNELLKMDLIWSIIPGATDSKDLGSLHDSANNTLCNLTDLGEELLDYVDSEALQIWKDREVQRGG